MFKAAARLFPFVMALAASVPCLAAPAMWEVRDDDSVIWLFGSFHVLPEDVQWRTALFERTLAQADEIIFEADIGPQAMAEMGAKAFARGIYTDGTLLTDLLDETAQQRLREVAGSIGLPMGSLVAMKPWLAANTLSVGAMAAEGYTAQGVEFVLQPALPADRQAFLESGDQQLDVLSGASEAEQLALLETTLGEIDALPAVLDQMMAHWVEGTPEKLAALFLSDMGGWKRRF
ncbi:MAG: TraB/GumN family protein [Devosia sp.]|nr:TraB/GumN family protein [Devosia sp.]